jgi:hypothetical protein
MVCEMEEPCQGARLLQQSRIACENRAAEESTIIIIVSRYFPISSWMSVERVRSRNEQQRIA